MRRVGLLLPCRQETSGSAPGHLEAGTGQSERQHSQKDHHAEIAVAGARHTGSRIARATARATTGTTGGATARPAQRHIYDVTASDIDLGFGGGLVDVDGILASQKSVEVDRGQAGLGGA